MRICPVCLESKSLTVEYFGASIGLARFAAICRICVDNLLSTHQKFCNHCKIVKPSTLFRKTTALGLRYRDECNDCLPGLQEIRLQRRKENARRAHNPWSGYSADELEILRAKSRERNRDRHRSGKVRKYFQNNINARLSRCLRASLNNALNGKTKSGSHIKDLGCTVDQLKKHLESQFKPGMTWNNHTLKGWHIDHIKPLSSFDLSDREQFLQAVHYTNLQPLWAHENLTKKCKKHD